MPSKVGISYCDEAGELTTFVGHKYLYERGVLHQDISPGNILIKWQPGYEGDEPSVSGCLIDLDHAKKGKPSLEMSSRFVDDVPAVDIALNKHVCLWCSDNKVDTEVAHRASAFFPVNQKVIPALIYLEAVLKHASTFRPTSQPLVTPQHLRWKSVRFHPFPFLSP